MSNQKKKEGTITLSQSKSIESQMRGMLGSLDESEAEWLLRNFERVENFIRRRPEDGLLTREIRGTVVVEPFNPRRKTLHQAGLLKFGPEEFVSDDTDDLFPGAYNGPKSVRFEMHAYAAGSPPYRGQRMYNTKAGLPRVIIDLRERGLVPANFHQAASLAVALARDIGPERWIRDYGPCRLYALGTSQPTRSHGDGVLIPVLLSPGVNERRGGEKRWVLDNDYLDRDGYRHVDAWFLTVTPAD